MGREEISINLIGGKGENTTDTILKWAIYVGRLLVILTEALALFVFFSRFSIDRRLSDLNDEIKVKKAQVAYFKNEDTFRRIQMKLQISKSNDASSAAVVNLYEVMLSRQNSDLVYTNLSVTPGSIIVTAQSAKSEVLSAFTQQLKKNPLITSLSIDKVENKPANALINITITALLQTKGK